MKNEMNNQYLKRQEGMKVQKLMNSNQTVKMTMMKHKNIHFINIYKF